jgi:hypothetical protein
MKPLPIMDEPRAALTVLADDPAPHGRQGPSSSSGAENDDSYRCPGERQPINRTLHLARLASGYAGCRACSRREELTGLPAQIARRTARQHARPVPTLLAAEGLRGRYLNQITCESLGRMTAHVLALAEEERMRPAPDGAATGRALCVLTGYDARSSSPQLAVALVAALRQSGCDILDAGRVSRPALDFAIQHLRPDLGLFITGGAHGDGWSGLDILDREALPWCAPGRLATLLESIDRPAVRIGRRGGASRPVDVLDGYRRALARQFHALRPLRIGISCQDELVREALLRALQDSPCTALLLNGLVADPDSPERYARTFGAQICERRADGGFVIGRDGRTCEIYDEGGNALNAAETEALLLRTLHTTSPAAEALRLGEGCPTEADLLRVQQERQAPLASDGAGRYWFLNEAPACDALQTLAKALEAFSLSQRPVSSYRQIALKRPAT